MNAQELGAKIKRRWVCEATLTDNIMSDIDSLVAMAAPYAEPLDDQTRRFAEAVMEHGQPHSAKEVAAELLRRRPIPARKTARELSDFIKSTALCGAAVTKALEELVRRAEENDK